MNPKGNGQRTMGGALVLIASVLFCLPLPAQTPGMGGPPKTGTVITTPPAIKVPPVLTPPPIAVPQPVSAPKLATPVDVGVPSPAWRVFPDGTFETAHPYPNNVAIWKHVTLPPGATKMRLYTIGVFALEPDYDALDLWGGNNSTWHHLKRYMGTAGPTRTDEFVGTSFSFRLTTDPSVTAQGFKIAMEFRN